MTITVRNADVPCKVFKTHVQNHAELKSTILESIAELGIHNAVTKFERISNTDWHIKKDLSIAFENRKYLKIVNPILTEHNKKVAEYTGSIGIYTNHVWFQQYEKLDFHGWHNHGNCMYSNVYYVELDKSCPRTSFKFMGTEFNIDVEEGDILTFPSFLSHCSRPNKSGLRKTVVAFNSNSEGVIDEQILDSV